MVLEVDEEKTERLFLKLKDGDGFYDITAKWDGCVDYREPDRGNEEQYLHICDLDRHIKILQGIKAEALKHFGSDWPT